MKTSRTFMKLPCCSQYMLINACCSHVVAWTCKHVHACCSHTTLHVSHLLSCHHACPFLNILRHALQACSAAHDTRPMPSALFAETSAWNGLSVQCGLSALYSLHHSNRMHLRCTHVHGHAGSRTCKWKSTHRHGNVQ